MTDDCCTPLTDRERRKAMNDMNNTDPYAYLNTPGSALLSLFTNWQRHMADDATRGITRRTIATAESAARWGTACDVIARCYYTNQPVTGYAVGQVIYDALAEHGQPPVWHVAGHNINYATWRKAMIATINDAIGYKP